jgi:phospholipase A1
MRKIIYNIGLLCSLMQANDIVNYMDGLDYYQKHEYKKAFPIVQKEAKRGNKEAQYLLATLYDKGEGTAKNHQKSYFWYKQAASNYAYIVEEQSTNKQESTPELENAFTQKRLQLAFSKLDLSTADVKDEVKKFVNKNFGIYPYHTNYFSPIAYASRPYNRHYTTSMQGSTPDTYNRQTEVEFQLSIQKVLSYNLLGLNDYLSLAYTQHVWWQAYDNSAPFREINYTPEIFFTIPSPYAIDEAHNLKAIQLGFRHQSNGQEGYRSRSWNSLFFSSLWQWDRLFLKAQMWYQLPEDLKGDDFYDGSNLDASGDDNPDLEEYIGYGDIQIKYLYGKNQFGLTWRNNLNLTDNRGSIELDYSTPLRNSDNTYWYVKYFNGYAESLIDYDRSTSKISFGFSFYRSLF